MLSSRLLPGSHLVATGRSYPITTEPRGQRFADYASEKLAGCQRNAERNSMTDARAVCAFAGDLPELPQVFASTCRNTPRSRAPRCARAERMTWASLPTDRLLANPQLGRVGIFANEPTARR